MYFLKLAPMTIKSESSTCGCLAQEEPYSTFSGMTFDNEEFSYLVSVQACSSHFGFSLQKPKLFPPPEFLTHGRYEVPPQSSSWACCYITCWMESNNLPHPSVSTRRLLLILRCPKVRKCLRRPEAGNLN